MGGAKKSKKKFNYDKNRKKERMKSKKVPYIGCKQIKQAWDVKQSVQNNMESMGLVLDPNKALPIGSKKKKGQKAINKQFVREELEAEAAIPEAKTLRLSEPEVRFCTYMMEKHGEDYKKMARDDRNPYQLTPKQIKKRIMTFKNIPEQYNEYLKSTKMDVD